MDLPAGDVSLIEAGESSFLAVVSQPNGGAVLVPITVDKGKFTLGDETPVGGTNPFVEDLRAMELHDGSWVVGARTCANSVRSAQLSDCKGYTTTVVHLDNGKTAVIGNYPELDSYGFIGEITDDHLLVQSNDLTAETSQWTYSDLDLKSGTLRTTAWQPEVVRTVDGVIPVSHSVCASEGAVMQLTVGEPPRRPHLALVSPDDPDSARSVPLEVDGDPNYLVCETDGTATLLTSSIAADRASGTYRTYQVSASGELTRIDEEPFIGEEYGGATGVGSMTVTLAPHKTLADRKAEAERAIAEGLPPLRVPQGPFSLLSLSDGEWTTSPVDPLPSENVWVTGDGHSYLGVSDNSVRGWNR